MRRAVALNRSHTRGFTLVELVAVLMLSALIATAVTVSLKEVGRDSQLQAAVNQWRRYDEETRVQARSFAIPMRLHVDPENGSLQRFDAEGSSPRGTAFELVKGKAGVRIERFMIGGNNDAAVDDLDLPVSNRGQSASYAVLLADSGARKRWLLIAGMSGQAREMTNEQDVREVFRLLQASGDDAD